MPHSKSICGVIGMAALNRTMQKALVCIATLCALPANAASPPRIVSQGTQQTPGCASCHGAAGDGSLVGVPRLAGQIGGYMVKQLNDFKTGRRASNVMQPIAKYLSAGDVRTAAAWYAAQSHPVPANPTPNAAQHAQGETLARVGDWSRNIPSCNSCHGPDGSGVAPSFPALRGQRPDYVIAQLKAWKAGQRKNDPMHLMGGVAAALTDADVNAVALYYGSLGGKP